MQGLGSAFENGLSVVIELMDFLCKKKVTADEISPIFETVNAHLGNIDCRS